MTEDDFPVRPRHVAIIMDGNGRWATARKLKRVKGHEKGSETVEAVVTFCARIGIPFMSLYAFSIDNWKRPRTEIACLMRLLKRFMQRKRALLLDNRIRLRVIGRRDLLAADVRREAEALEKATAGGDRMILCLALSYGSREELTGAARQACRDAVAGSLDPETLMPAVFEKYLDTAGIPDPDIFIRTGGEKRLSDFLLWQASYAELFFTDTLWPDFTVDEMTRIIRDFAGRERRFGGIRA